MKKLPFLLTLILVAAMLLSACAEGEQGGETVGTVFPTGEAGAAEGAGATEGAGAAEGTQTLEPTTDPITGSDGGTGATDGAGAQDGAGAAATGTVGGEAGGVTATAPAGGDGAAPTPTITLVTGGAGGSLTQTPTAPGSSGAIPQTGQEEQYVLLSDILKMQVQGQDGNQVGSVGGVMIDRATGSGSASGTGSTDTGTNPLQSTTPTLAIGATATVDASGGAGGTATATPGAAAPTQGSGGSLTSAGERPRISYILVSVSSGASASTSTTASAQGDGNQVLIPWQAFEVSGLRMGASGGPFAASQAETPTPSTGGQDGGLSTQDDLALVLAVDSAALAAAPRFEPGRFSGQVEGEIARYWAGEIAGIPATGAPGAEAGGQVLIRGQIGSISIRGTQGENLGQVRDFVVDSETGELAYAVLSGGSTFRGSVYVVPASLLIWQAGPGNSPGSFQMNVPTAVFSGAPVAGSVEAIGSSPDWFTEVDQYWMGQK